MHIGIKPQHYGSQGFTPGKSSCKDVNSLSTSCFSDKDKASIQSEIQCGKNNFVVISKWLKSMRSNLSG